MRKINNTAFINTSLHVTKLFTLAIEINTLVTGAESIYSICKTDFNNGGVAIIMGLINLNPKPYCCSFKRRESSGVTQKAWQGRGAHPHNPKLSELQMPGPGSQQPLFSSAPLPGDDAARVTWDCLAGFP